MDSRSGFEKILPPLLKTVGFFALYEAIFFLILALLFKVPLQHNAFAILSVLYLGVLESASDFRCSKIRVHT